MLPRLDTFRGPPWHLRHCLACPVGQNGTEWYRIRKNSVPGHQVSGLSALNLAKCPLLSGKNGTGLENMGQHGKKFVPSRPMCGPPGTAWGVPVQCESSSRHPVAKALQPNAIVLPQRRFTTSAQSPAEATEDQHRRSMLR